MNLNFSLYISIQFNSISQNRETNPLSSHWPQRRSETRSRAARVWIGSRNLVRTPLAYTARTAANNMPEEVFVLLTGDRFGSWGCWALKPVYFSQAASVVSKWDARMRCHSQTNSGNQGWTPTFISNDYHRRWWSCEGGVRNGVKLFKEVWAKWAQNYVRSLLIYRVYVYVYICMMYKMYENVYNVHTHI